jgi:hypothetical protein
LAALDQQDTCRNIAPGADIFETSKAAQTNPMPTLF